MISCGMNSCKNIFNCQDAFGWLAKTSNNAPASGQTDSTN